MRKIRRFVRRSLQRIQYKIAKAIVGPIACGDIANKAR